MSQAGQELDVEQKFSPATVKQESLPDPVVQAFADLSKLMGRIDPSTGFPDVSSARSEEAKEQSRIMLTAGLNLITTVISPSYPSTLDEVRELSAKIADSEDAAFELFGQGGLTAEQFIVHSATLDAQRTRLNRRRVAVDAARVADVIQNSMQGTTIEYPEWYGTAKATRRLRHCETVERVLGMIAEAIRCYEPQYNMAVSYGEHASLPPPDTLSAALLELQSAWKTQQAAKAIEVDATARQHLLVGLNMSDTDSFPAVRFRNDSVDRTDHANWVLEAWVLHALSQAGEGEFFSAQRIRDGMAAAGKQVPLDVVIAQLSDSRDFCFARVCNEQTEYHGNVLMTYLKVSWNGVALLNRIGLDKRREIQTKRPRYG